MTRITEVIHAEEFSTRNLQSFLQSFLRPEFDASFWCKKCALSADVLRVCMVGPQRRLRCAMTSALVGRRT